MTSVELSFWATGKWKGNITIGEVTCPWRSVGR